ncbi:hypothetical protein WJX84_008965 [Apatococcus fuscideae]|uniref:Uncharacterized protein n=1 Tax=Apatococcus fuscideae TaxID=2026836 RepID=A0AAW1SUW3_9CHLO
MGEAFEEYLRITEMSRHYLLSCGIGRATGAQSITLAEAYPGAAASKALLAETFTPRPSRLVRDKKRFLQGVSKDLLRFNTWQSDHRANVVGEEADIQPLGWQDVNFAAIFDSRQGGKAPAADMRLWLNHADTGKQTLVYLRFKCEAGLTNFQDLRSDYEALDAATGR